MISCAQTNNEIICDQEVPPPFLCPPSSFPDLRLTQEVMLSLPEVDKESRSSYNDDLLPQEGDFILTLKASRHF